MKRISRPAASAKRKGTLFHYYMMYLFLSSVLMTTAGLCLHSILKADRVDTKVAEYLTALERLDLAFREDASSLAANIEAGGIRFDAGNENFVRWTIQEHRLLRESFRADQVETTERFLFPRDTSIEIVQDSKFVICRVKEPSSMPAGYEEAPSQVKMVEIIASVRKPKFTVPAKDESVEKSTGKPSGESDEPSDEPNAETGTPAAEAETSDSKPGDQEAAAAKTDTQKASDQ